MHVARPFPWKRCLAVLALVVLGPGCGETTPTPSPDGPLVVATTTILGDVARNVVGEFGTVEVLLPIGADPHAFQASARQASSIASADLVLANGLMLEEGLTDVLQSARADGANVLELGPLLAPTRLGGTEGGASDPHVWLDPIRMAEAAGMIADALETIDNEGPWRTQSDAYRQELEALDAEVRRVLGDIPPGERILITNHDSLGYFAARYDLEIVGTVIPGGASLADPSSAQLADLVRLIETNTVLAIFAETTTSTDLAEAVADEVGFDVAVVELFTGSLGEPGSGAETLVDLLLTNAQRIADALTP